MFILDNNLFHEEVMDFFDHFWKEPNICKDKSCFFFFFKEWSSRDKWTNLETACLVSTTLFEPPYGHKPEFREDVRRFFYDSVNETFKIISTWNTPCNEAHPFFYINKCLENDIYVQRDLLGLIKKKFRDVAGSEENKKYPKLADESIEKERDKKNDSDQLKETVDGRNRRWQQEANEIYKTDQEIQKNSSPKKLIVKRIYEEEPVINGKKSPITTIMRIIKLDTCIRAFTSKAKGD